jgi:hypothetical protein
MKTWTVPSPQARLPAWLRAAAVVGILWNIYGIYQFAGTLTPAGQAAMTAGMTRAQADLYLGLPAWIGMVFALGVFGGLIGSTALTLGRRSARPALAASLLGYVLLLAGDAWFGVFDAIPRQLAVLAVVVLIAAGLAWAARFAGRRGLLN